MICVPGSIGNCANFVEINFAATTACMIRYIRLADPDLLPSGRYPSLDALSQRCEALPAFRATYPADYVVPSNG